MVMVDTDCGNGVEIESNVGKFVGKRVGRLFFDGGGLGLVSSSLSMSVLDMSV